MLVEEAVDVNLRWTIMKMMYGAQDDKYDYHNVNLLQYIILLINLILFIIFINILLVYLFIYFIKNLLLLIFLFNIILNWL
jgi:hypothetical protein